MVQVQYNSLGPRYLYLCPHRAGISVSLLKTRVRSQRSALLLPMGLVVAQLAPSAALFPSGLG